MAESLHRYSRFCELRVSEWERRLNGDSCSRLANRCMEYCTLTTNRMGGDAYTYACTTHDLDFLDSIDRGDPANQPPPIPASVVFDVDGYVTDELFNDEYVIDESI